MFRFLILIVLVFNIFSSAQASAREFKIAAILVKFQNDVDNTAYLGAYIPLTPEVCREFLFESPKSVAAYYTENSYGKFQVSGDVFGPYVIPVDAQSATDNSACKCKDEAIAVAQADGMGHNYSAVFIIYPRSRDENGAFVNYCGFQGAGEQGSNIFWINGFLDLHILAHEIGHRLGREHAGKLVCDECYHYNAGCQGRSTQDPFDPMGYSTAPGYRGPGHYNAFNKLGMDWLNENNVLTIAEPGTSEVVLTALEKNSGGIKCLFLPISTSQRYCIEFRQNYGFDEFLSPLNGLLFRVVSAHGTEGHTTIVEPACDSEALVVRKGDVFRDDDLPIQIEVIEQQGDSINVRVIYDAPNFWAVLADDWPDTVSVNDEVNIPITLYNNSVSDISDSISLYVKFLNQSRSFITSETVDLTSFLPKRDSINVLYTFAPMLGCGIYNLKMFVKPPQSFKEINIEDNYLTDKEEGALITVLCDGPELNTTLTTLPQIFEPGEAIEISYEIENSGIKDSGPFSIDLSIGDEQMIQRIDNIAVGEKYRQSLVRDFDCGVFAISAYVDKNKEVAENDEIPWLYENKIWSAQLCDGSLTTILYGFGRNDFKCNNSMVFSRRSDHDFHFYSRPDKEYKIVHPQFRGFFTTQCAISNQYCVLVEKTADDSSFINIHNLSTGAVQMIPSEHAAQFAPTVNDEWIVWLEGQYNSRTNILYAQKIHSGEKIKLDENVYTRPPKLTAANLLYWGNSPFRFKVLNLSSESAPVELDLRYFSRSRFEKNTIVTFETNEFEKKIVWREFNEQSDTLSSVLHSFSHESLNTYPRILAANGQYVVYRDHYKELVFLYSRPECTLRCISDLVGDIEVAYLRGDEIIGLFDYPWEHYIGAVKISDLLNVPVSVKEKTDEPAATFSAAPNPFNSQTTIRFSLPQIANIELAIFNTMGQQVRTYASGMLDSGSHSFVWDGSGENSTPLASGVYFCVIQVDGEFSSQPLKVLLIK
jgi:hypothetical protein